MATPADVPRQNTGDYYPQAIVFDAICLHSLPVVGPAVFVPASSSGPASGILLVDHPELSVGSLATLTSPVGSFSVTIAAPQVLGPVPTQPPAIPVAITDAYEAHLRTCRSIRVAGPNGVMEALRVAQAWFRRSSRYASLLGRYQEVKEGLASILQEKA